MSEENVNKHPYKVMIGDEIMVFRSEFNGKAFYKAQFTKTNWDKTKSKFYKELRFKKGVDLPNNTLIKVVDMFEDVRENKNDKYNPIWSLFITEFEYMDKPDIDKGEAISNYNNQINEDDDFFADVKQTEIDEDSLPF